MQSRAAPTRPPRVPSHGLRHKRAARAQHCGRSPRRDGRRAGTLGNRTHRHRPRPGSAGREDNTDEEKKKKKKERPKLHSCALDHSTPQTCSSMQGIRHPTGCGCLQGAGLLRPPHRTTVTRSSCPPPACPHARTPARQPTHSDTRPPRRPPACLSARPPAPPPARSTVHPTARPPVHPQARCPVRSPAYPAARPPAACTNTSRRPTPMMMKTKMHAPHRPPPGASPTPRPAAIPQQPLARSWPQSGGSSPCRPPWSA